jgi:hypothetical protein
VAAVAADKVHGAVDKVHGAAVAAWVVLGGIGGTVAADTSAAGAGAVDDWAP